VNASLKRQQERDYERSMNAIAEDRIVINDMMSGNYFNMRNDVNDSIDIIAYVFEIKWNVE